MDTELTWERLKALAAEERQPRESLERTVAQTGGSADLLFRLARACVRDGRLTEALGHYDHAELLGHPEARAERSLVARHVGDFPDQDGNRLA